MSRLRASGQWATVNGVERAVKKTRGERVFLGTIEDPWVEGESVDMATCERIYWLDSTARWRGGDVNIYIVTPQWITVLTYDPNVVEGLTELHGDARDGWIAPALEEELTDIKERIYDEQVINP